MDTYESVLFVCRQVDVYKIPPRSSSAGYRAQQWNDQPDALIWKGRLRVIETSQLGTDDAQSTVELRLEDADSGDLFANSPYTDGGAVEPVIDSSRYFVLRVVDPASKQKAFLGIGFQERSDAFDFNVSLQEWTRRQQAAKEPQETQAAGPKQPTRDYSLKEGEMISINIGGSASTFTASAPKATTASATAIPFLPPPPASTSSHVRRKT